MTSARAREIDVAPELLFDGRDVDVDARLAFAEDPDGALLPPWRRHWRRGYAKVKFPHRGRVCSGCGGELGPFTGLCWPCHAERFKKNDEIRRISAMSELNPKNYCVPCGEDFGSLDLFDRHRVGKHEYTYSEGAAMDPPREDGRRCLDAEEMREKGWDLDRYGRWVDLKKVASIRAYYQEAAQEPDSQPLTAFEASGGQLGLLGADAA